MTVQNGNRAVEYAIEGFVYRVVYTGTYRACDRYLHDDVQGAVNEASTAKWIADWIMHRAVRNDPDHPNLNHYLSEDGT